MAASTSENEVTVRRLNETLAGLWAAVKSEVSGIEDKISERSVFDADFDNDELVITKRA